jgi:SAM-dependent methyltransferase
MFDRIIDRWRNLRYGARYASNRYCARYDAWKTCCYDNGKFAEKLLRLVNPHGVAVDFGTGTGFLARILSDRCNSVYAFDRSRSMIEYARGKFAREGRDNVTFAVADHRSVALEDRADIIVAGYTMLSLVTQCWDDGWEKTFDEVISRMMEMLKPDGRIAILEAASLYGELPVGQVFHPKRKALLDRLVSVHGFKANFIESQWAFDTVRHKRATLRFIGGRKILATDLHPNEPNIQECVAVYVKQI